MRPVSVKRPEGLRTTSSTTVMTMRMEDLIVALFLCTLGRAGEGRDINNVDWMYSPSDDGVDDDDGSFVLRAGDTDGGRLLFLAGWQVNSITCSRWADWTTRNHACRQVLEPIAATSAAPARGTKMTRWCPLPLVMSSAKICLRIGAVLPRGNAEMHRW